MFVILYIYISIVKHIITASISGFQFKENVKRTFSTSFTEANCHQKCRMNCVDI